MSKIKLQATDGNGGTISLKGPTTTDGNAEFELTLPANDGSSGQYLKTDGSGALSWSTVSAGTALTGSTDNTICTVTGANAIAGEANLTFDGSQLGVGSSSNYGTIGTAAAFQVQGTNTGSNTSINIVNAATSNASSTCDVNVWQDYRLSTRIISGRENASNWTSSASAAASYLGFYTNSAGSVTEHLRIESDGDIMVKTNDIVVEGAGKGILLGGTAAANKLDDYEEGVWDATCANSVTLHADANKCTYVKIGTLVHVAGEVRVNDTNGGSDFKINNLPFTTSNLGEGSGFLTGSVSRYNWSLASGYYRPLLNASPNTTTMIFRQDKETGNAIGLDAIANGYLVFNFTYKAA